MTPNPALVDELKARLASRRTVAVSAGPAESSTIEGGPSHEPRRVVLSDAEHSNRVMNDPDAWSRVNVRGF